MATKHAPTGPTTCAHKGRVEHHVYDAAQQSGFFIGWCKICGAIRAPNDDGVDEWRYPTMTPTYAPRPLFDMSDASMSMLASSLGLVERKAHLISIGHATKATRELADLVMVMAGVLAEVTGAKRLPCRCTNEPGDTRCPAHPRCERCGDEVPYLGATCYSVDCHPATAPSAAVPEPVHDSVTVPLALAAKLDLFGALAREGYVVDTGGRAIPRPVAPEKS